MMPFWFPDSQQNPARETPCLGVQFPEKLYEQSSESSHPPTILIVDDSVYCRMVLRTAMEVEGFCCVEAADGMAALNVFREISIDFIITDFQMPIMNGCEFLEILAKEGTWIPPAVMITGNLTNSVRMRAMRAGACAILSKPFDRTEILGLVREVQYRKRASLH